MVGNVLHGLEPVVGVSELSNDESFVGIAVGRRILEPVLVTGQLGSNFDGMTETLLQVTAKQRAKNGQPRSEEKRTRNIVLLSVPYLLGGPPGSRIALPQQGDHGDVRVGFRSVVVFGNGHHPAERRFHLRCGENDDGQKDQQDGLLLVFRHGTASWHCCCCTGGSGMPRRSHDRAK